MPEAPSSSVHCLEDSPWEALKRPGRKLAQICLEAETVRRFARLYYARQHYLPTLDEDERLERLVPSEEVMHRREASRDCAQLILMDKCPLFTYDQHNQQVLPRFQRLLRPGDPPRIRPIE